MQGKTTQTQFAGRMPTKSPIKATAFFRTMQRTVDRILKASCKAESLLKHIEFMLTNTRSR